MPLKEETEVQLLRSLSNTPLQVEITFLTTATYIGTNTPASHLNEFYKTFEDVKDRKFDGLIITGAPIEHMEYEDVQYWDELTKIMDWSNTNVTSTLHICCHISIRVKLRYNKRFAYIVSNLCKTL